MKKNICALIVLMLISQNLYCQVLNYFGTEFSTSQREFFLTTNRLYFCGSNSAQISIYDPNDSLIFTFQKTSNSCDTVSFYPATSPTDIFGNFIKNRYKIIASDSISMYESYGGYLGTSLTFIATPTDNFYSNKNTHCGYSGINSSGNYFEASTLYINSLNAFDDSIKIYANKPHPLMVNPPYFSVRITAKENWTNTAAGDLSGSIIEGSSNSKYQVFAGRVSANGCCAWNGLSPMSNYMIAKDYVKDEYYTVPYLTRLGDNYRAFTYEDSTEIKINNGSPILLNKGDLLDTVMSVPIKWTGNKNFGLLQISRQQTADSVINSSTFLNPVFPSNSLITHAYFTSELVSDSFAVMNKYLNLACRCKDTSLVFLDSNLLTGFAPYVADSNWCYAQKSISSGLHELQADSGVLAQMYAYGYMRAYSATISGDRVLYPTTGLASTLKPENDLKLFPNPTSGNFNIEFLNPAQKIQRIEIFNINGQLIFSENNINKKATTINLIGFQSGIYFVKIHTSNSIYFRKVMVQN
jgi:hypothetical protein